ncbi:MAG: peptidylprolyl isomerase [bacterium]|nr:peptidylprolyl isomerase [bacterium]
MQISKNKVVSIGFKLTDGDGSLIDESSTEEPLKYIQGVGSFIPAVESALEGKEEGAELKVTVTPEEGFGQRDEELVHSVPKDRFQSGGDLQVGMQVQGQDDSGTPAIFTVVALEDDTVKLDGNHPLAGMTLNFDVKVGEIRDATQEEIDHGHVHGPGGHQH